MLAPEDLKAVVRADVLARRPVDRREADSIDRFVAELDRLRAPFDEDADPVHVTGSAFIVGIRGIVLLRHRRLGIWVQPGGHLDAGETPWDAARREAAEETGMAVRFADLDEAGRPRLAHVDVHEGGRGHLHLDLRYVLDAGDADPTPPVGESQEVHWLTWSDALARAEHGMAGVLAHLGGLRGASSGSASSGSASSCSAASSVATIGAGTIHGERFAPPAAPRRT